MLLLQAQVLPRSLHQNPQVLRCLTIEELDNLGNLLPVLSHLKNEDVFALKLPLLARKSVIHSLFQELRLTSRPHCNVLPAIEQLLDKHGKSFEDATEVLYVRCEILVALRFCDAYGCWGEVVLAVGRFEPGEFFGIEGAEGFDEAVGCSGSG